MQGKIKTLERELINIRHAAVVAHIAGDTAKAACLTGKAVGMKSALEIAERACSKGEDRSAIGELEGMERVILELQPLPHCEPRPAVNAPRSDPK